MSDNEKREEKWTINLRDDQCLFIREAMAYIESRAAHSENNRTAFTTFACDRTAERAKEIRELIASVTS